MNTREILNLASDHLRTLKGHSFDILTISKPATLDIASDLAKITSKLSPFLGNLIEFNTVNFLNDMAEFRSFGEWKRQDPGFPDTIFAGLISPTPGFEIKAWMPLATEITARFKDSQDYFTQDQTYVCLLAWLPDQMIFGNPYIIDVCTVSGQSIAKARDRHYHQPPGYLVIEPEDTSNRTRNLQQRNTNGYKFQGTSQQFSQAKELIDSWGLQVSDYQTDREYQNYLRQLLANFPYRLDTNFAKIDRIMHDDIETFKRRVLNHELHGMSIKEWSRILGKKDNKEKLRILEHLIRNQN